MQAEIKIDGKDILAKRSICDPWFKLPDKVRVGWGAVIKVEQWFNPEKLEMVFIMDQLRMSMNRSEFCQNNEITMISRSSDNRPTVAHYHLPTILLCPNILSESSKSILLNHEGMVLSGSNIYGEGYDSIKYGQCLGGSYDPFTAQPVELLVTNTANNDLSWIGDRITGFFSQEDDIGRIFTIETWPALPKELFEWKPPEQIKERLDALLLP